MAKKEDLERCSSCKGVGGKETVDDLGQRSFEFCQKCKGVGWTEKKK